MPGFALSWSSAKIGLDGAAAVGVGSLRCHFNPGAVALLDELAMDVSYAPESLKGEEEHKQAKERILSLARFVDENPHPVIRVTTNGAFIYENKAIELLTSSWAGGTERKVPEDYLRALTHAWESRETQGIEICVGSVTYAVSIVPLTAAGYINLYGRDVTEAKTLTQRLNQAQKIEAIGQQTGGVAHDFNNIIQVITGYCEVLKLSLPEESKKHVEQVAIAAQRAAALTTQLLAFSRKQILRPRVVNTKNLICSSTVIARLGGERLSRCISLLPSRKPPNPRPQYRAKLPQKGQKQYSS